MTGQEWRERLDDTNGADPGPSSTVGNAKGFVEIKMANVRADVRRPAKTDLRVHVSAVHVNHTPCSVNLCANVLDVLLEDSVRGRIGHHQSGESFPMCLDFSVQITTIDVS